MCVWKHHDLCMIIVSFEIPKCVIKMTEQMCSIVLFMFGSDW